MLSMLSDNWGNIIAIALVAALLALALRSIIRDKRAGKCVGCSGCSSSFTIGSGESGVASDPDDKSPSCNCSACALAGRCPGRK